MAGFDVATPNEYVSILEKFYNMFHDVTIMFFIQSFYDNVV